MIISQRAREKERKKEREREREIERARKDELTHCSVHLQENGPKVAFVDVEVNSCKTKARVIRMKLQPLSSRPPFAGKSNT